MTSRASNRTAGSRIAWIANTGGNTESNDRLFTSSLPGPRERKLAATMRTGDVDCVLTGRALGGLVGSGNLLAYNIWATAAASPGDEQSCATKITSGSLRRITASGTSPLRTGTDTVSAQGADGIEAVAVSKRAIAYAYNVYERVHEPATYRDAGNVAVILVSQLG